MTIQVLWFGGLRDRVGTARSTQPLPSPPTVAALKAQLESQHPWLAPRWSVVRVAVQLELAEDTTLIPDGAEVALLPPVAGGAPEHPRVLLAEAPLSVDAAIQQVRAPGLGGLCVFAGLVRDHARGVAVTAIDYSAYSGMALRVMERIVVAAEAQHGARVACHHRVGHLVVGDLAVVIASAAPHRAECFAATRQVIEELKKDVPIWKKEFGTDGETWVGMGP